MRVYIMCVSIPKSIVIKITVIQNNNTSKTTLSNTYLVVVHVRPVNCQVTGGPGTNSTCQLRSCLVQRDIFYLAVLNDAVSKRCQSAKTMRKIGRLTGQV